MKRNLAQTKSVKVTRSCVTGVPIRIGVMGSADTNFKADIGAVCRKLGRAIARQGCCLLTGACTGLPHEAILGAKELEGNTVGISPANNLKEHKEFFQSPFKEYDVLIFTGMGLMGRELINIRSSDIVIIVGGRSGTLGEFAIAYECGKLIGVLKNTGGIAQEIRQLDAKMKKKTGAEIIYEADPEKLVTALLKRYQSGQYVSPQNLVTP